MAATPFSAIWLGTPSLEDTSRAGDPEPGGPRAVSFMEIVADPSVDGGWRFEREVPGLAGWTGITRNYEQRMVLATVPPSELLCPRHVFRIDDARVIPLPAQVMVAQHPYSGGWIHGLRWVDRNGARHPEACLLFKRGSNKGPHERPDASRQRFGSRDDALRWLDSHEHDYWDTSSVRLTAGILDLNPSMPPNPRHVDAWDPANLMVKAICADLPSAYGGLSTSATARRLLDQVDAGSLKIHLPNRGKVWLSDLPGFAHAREEASAMLHLSIQQALAGPHSSSEDWFGRPVADLLEHVFRDNMSTIARAGGKDRELELSEDAETWASRVRASGRTEEVAEAIDALGDDLASLVRAIHFEERRIEDLAREQGLSESTLRRRLKEAERRLAELLQG